MSFWTEWPVWALGVVGVVLIACLKGSLNQFLPAPQRARLALGNLVRSRTPPPEDRFRVVLCWLHVFLCMLAYYLQWNLRQRLALLLYEDDDPAAARAARSSPVEPARVSESAVRKANSRRTPDGLPLHSLSTLLADLATLTLNEIILPGSPNAVFPLRARPTPLQQRAFQLLHIQPDNIVASNLAG